MEPESIVHSWGDILSAIQSKEEDPTLFQRLFISSMNEHEFVGPHHADVSESRNVRKWTRTPICFVNESEPQIYFTRREAQCVACIIKGYTNPQAAEVLDLSKRTIEFYIKNVRRKLNCRNKSELLEIIKKTSFAESIDLVLADAHDDK